MMSPLTGSRTARLLGRALAVEVGLGVLAALWEGYKARGPVRGASVLGVPVLPRTDDTAMPHLHAIWDVFGENDASGSQKTLTFGSHQSSGSSSVLHSIVTACGHTLQWAVVALAVTLIDLALWRYHRSGAVS